MLGDVEHDGRPVLDVRLELPVGRPLRAAPSSAASSSAAATSTCGEPSSIAVRLSTRARGSYAR